MGGSPGGQVTCRKSAGGSHTAGENAESRPSQKFPLQTGALFRDLKQVVPGTLGQAGRSLRGGKGVSKMICREGLADRA